MVIAFWVLVGLTLYAYAGYPLLIRALAALTPRRHTIDPGHAPTLTVLIPAYNEQAVIAAKLENTLALDYPPGRLDVLVASESTDGTDAIVSRYAARGVRLLPSAQRRGKAGNLARAVPHATGEILLFTDANAQVRPDAARLLAARFADPRVGAVSGWLLYTTEADDASGSGEEAYWDLELGLKRAESALGSLPGAVGSLFALRRPLYEPTSPTRGDDFELPIGVILKGHDSVLEPAAISREQADGSYRAQMRHRMRMIHTSLPSAVILFGRAVARGRTLLALQIASHKLLRWAVALWLPALAILSWALWREGPVYAAAALSQGVLYTLALGGALCVLAGRRPPALLNLPLYFVTVNLAALGGIALSASGKDVRWHKRVDRVV